MGMDERERGGDARRRTKRDDGFAAAARGARLSSLVPAAVGFASLSSSRGDRFVRHVREREGKCAFMCVIADVPGRGRGASALVSRWIFSREDRIA